jgi:hypothetical protein
LDIGYRYRHQKGCNDENGTNCRESPGMVIVMVGLDWILEARDSE